MQHFLSVTPSDIRCLPAARPTLAHVAYRIVPDNALLRQNLLLQTKGGLLSVSDANAPHVDHPKALCSAVLRECSRRSYSGVVLDFESTVRSDLLRFAQQLAAVLAEKRMDLFVPESYAKSAPSAIPLICTALSGGDLTERLEQAMAAYPGRRLALDIQRLRMDFDLPSRSGKGQPLSESALRTLMNSYHPFIFFSHALCIRYFTYTQNGIAHFVLFDDADTLRQKLCIGSKLGYCAAFFQWPEICDIADRLFPQAKKQPSAP